VTGYVPMKEEGKLEQRKEGRRSLKVATGKLRREEEL
jgi:hypothetical protein